MILKLPKFSRDGKAKQTVIEADAIKGTEPCNIFHQGKVYKGCKVYTTGGTYFKVFADAVEVLMLKTHVQTTKLPAQPTNILTGEKAKYLTVSPIGTTLPALAQSDAPLVQGEGTEIKLLNPGQKKEMKKWW